MGRTPRPHYKYYIGLTSQISFCQVPFRLDIFNQCSFSCSYCFAKARGGHRGTRKLQVARPENLSARFERIKDSRISSSVDEFLARRIPIQLGGMTDPFSSFEQETSATLNALQVLARENYPTLISTKSTIPARQNYLEELSVGNFMVRFSISIIHPSLRNTIERGIPSPAELFGAVETLSAAGVSCAIRFQPVIPGHEQHAFKLVERARNSGARHITIEYLKLPVDDLNSHICKLENGKGKKLIDLYRFSGAIRQGRELVLPPTYKIGFLSEIGKFARELGLSVGFGDNEFLAYSDGRSCCNGADLYLSDMNLFEANPASLIRRKKKGESIQFSEFASEWIPTSSVNTYLNSRVRAKPKRGRPEWYAYLEEHWKIGSIYSPDFFHGVRFFGSHDDAGMPIFVRVQDML
jgi:DNA repair photolyase